jgi:molybdopterin-synthase adenylyltransferase
VSDYSRLEDTDFPVRLTRQLTVAIIGAGALGNAVAQILCMNGIRELLVVDPDTVQPSDLSRSVLFRHPGSLGRNKAEALAAALGPLFPDTSVRAFATEIADMNTVALGAASLWFSCVDSLVARLEIAHLSTLLRIPVIDGGLGSDVSQGRVSWFPLDGACFSCILPRSVRARLLSKWEAHASPCGRTDERTSFPSTPSLAAYVAGAQVELGLRSFFEQRPGSVTARLWTRPELRLEVVSNNVSELCPFHWDRDFEMVAVSDSTQSVSRFLSARAADTGFDPYLLLPWPVCVRAECSACGGICEPLCRAGLVARHTVCRFCGCAAVRGIESVRAIPIQSPLARHSLCDLGIREGPAMVGHARDVL